MARATVWDIEKREKGDVDLPDELFSAEVNEHVLQEVVRMQLVSRRSGTACAKERSAVAGGGRKPYRQKHTGRARQGSSRSANHPKGGKVFPPRPRSYEFRPPRGVRRKALITALSLYCRDGRLTILDGFELEAPKTRRFVEVMTRFDAPTGVVVDAVDNTNLRLSVRNTPGFVFLPPEGLNVYDILRHDRLFLTRSGLEGVSSRLARKAGRGAEAR